MYLNWQSLPLQLFAISGNPGNPQNKRHCKIPGYYWNDTLCIFPRIKGMPTKSDMCKPTQNLHNGRNYTATIELVFDLITGSSLGVYQTFSRNQAGRSVFIKMIKYQSISKFSRCSGMENLKLYFIYQNMSL